MRDTATFTLPDHQRMAQAFLALTDDPATDAVQRSLVKALAAFAAALVIALAAPVLWTAPTAPVTPGKLVDQPAATLANSKAAPAVADDEDAAGD
jgi:hypothetical protein